MEELLRLQIQKLWRIAHFIIIEIYKMFLSRNEVMILTAEMSSI